MYGDIIAACQYLKGVCWKAKEGLFVRNSTDRTSSNGYKLKERKLMLDIRKEFFTARVVRDTGTGCPEVVATPTVGMFAARLDVVLSNLVH